MKQERLSLSKTLGRGACAALMQPPAVSKLPLARPAPAASSILLNSGPHSRHSSRNFHRLGSVCPSPQGLYAGVSLMLVWLMSKSRLLMPFFNRTTSDRRFASLQLLLEDWHGLCALFERRKVLGTGAL